MSVLYARGEDSIRQAGRNLLISFRESVAKELNAVVGDNVKAAFSSDALARLILTAVENWTKDTEAGDISVLIGSRELASMEAELLAGLKERMCQGVTLKADDNFEGDSAFRSRTDRHIMTIRRKRLPSCCTLR